MPIQFRPTLDQSSDPTNQGDNPAKYVTIGGQQYYATFGNYSDLVRLRVAERESKLGRPLERDEKMAVEDAIRIAATLPSVKGSGITPADVAPIPEFGSFGDYIGIFTSGMKKSADEFGKYFTGEKGPAAAIGKGLGTVELLAVGVVIYILVKG